MSTSSDQNLAELLSSELRSLSRRALLAMALGAGCLGLVVAATKPPGWRALVPSTLALLFCGAWGVMDREVTSFPNASRLLTATRRLFAVFGGVAALVAFAQAFELLLGASWKS